MIKLVEDMAKALVDKPDEVTVTQRNDKDITIIELHVSEEDMGKVIGKQGRIANAMRSIIKVAAIKNNEKIGLDIIG